jgi:hypothetical protein
MAFIASCQIAITRRRLSAFTGWLTAVAASGSDALVEDDD